ncbi:MAG: DUF502 domain-containing protein [Woeseiaceae bacterium]
MKFIKTTLIGGAVFMVPVVLLFMIVLRAHSILKAAVEPMARFLPIHAVGGIALSSIIAAAILLLICFLAGILARSAVARSAIEAVEAKILNRIPGYTLLRAITNSRDENRVPELQPVLAKLDDMSQVGFEVERLPDGRCVVYLPNAPNPLSGIVCVLDAHRVTPLEISAKAVQEHVEQLGKGSAALFEAHRHVG